MATIALKNKNEMRALFVPYPYKPMEDSLKMLQHKSQYT